jgi:hypothetical protein
MENCGGVKYGHGQDERKELWFLIILFCFILIHKIANIMKQTLWIYFLYEKIIVYKKWSGRCALHGNSEQQGIKCCNN